jgi:hypothetical protein
LLRGVGHRRVFYILMWKVFFTHQIAPRVSSDKSWPRFSVPTADTERTKTSALYKRWWPVKTRQTEKTRLPEIQSCGKTYTRKKPKVLYTHECFAYNIPLSSSDS